jgi:hypothetical protein
MAYVVQREFFNGYRCSCCQRYWDDTTIVKTLDEALEYVPLENDGESDSVLESVEVTDGATGDLIAWGRLSYPQFGRYSGYGATRWVGCRGGEKFDSAGSDEEWAAQLADIERGIRQQELDKAKAELAKAQEKVDRLQK